MLVVPQSRPAGASPFGRIPTVDNSGRGIPMAALAGTPDGMLRAKFPAIAQALDHFSKASTSKFSLKITWAGYEGMNFSEELTGTGLVKGMALAFDRFLREATSFAGKPPAANLRPQQYRLHDLMLIAIVTFSGNVFQAEVQLQLAG